MVGNGGSGRENSDGVKATPPWREHAKTFGVGRRTLAAVPTGLERSARAGETVRAAGASRHRAARAREVLVMESFLGRAVCATSSLALLEKQRRFRG